MELINFDEIIHNIKNQDSKTFYIDAIKCYYSNIYRGAILLSWIALIEDIKYKVEVIVKNKKSDEKATFRKILDMCNKSE